MRRRTLLMAAGLVPLPSLASPEDLRTPLEVCERVLALIAVSSAAHDRARSEAWLSQHKLRPVLSPKEASFLRAKAPDERQRVQFSWRIEAVAPLLWALGRLATLPSHDQPVALDHSALLKQIWNEPLSLAKAARLRPSSVVWDAQFEIMDAHWRIRDAMIHRRPIPFGLDLDLVPERHHAFNWLVRDMDKAWDDVETNT